MAVVPKVTRASMDSTTGMLASQISGLIAGAAIPALAFCYIDSATGKVFPTDATAADQKAQLAGVCPRAANVGEPVTLFGIGTVITYVDGVANPLTPGTRYFLDVTANAGGLNTVATVGDAAGKVQAISASAIRIVVGI